MTESKMTAAIDIYHDESKQPRCGTCGHFLKKLVCEGQFIEWYCPDVVSASPEGGEEHL